MTQPMSKSEELIAFLNGEGPLDGVWFGEPHPTERGNFWWRKRLSALRQGEGSPRGWLVVHSYHGTPYASDFCETAEEMEAYRTRYAGAETTVTPLYAHPPAQAATQGEGDGEAMAREDAEIVGAGYTVDGVRICPTRIQIYLPKSQPERPQGGEVICAELDQLIVRYGNARAKGNSDEAAELYTRIACRNWPAPPSAPAVGEADGVALKPSTILEALRRTWKRWGYTEDEMKARAVDSSTDISLLWDMGKLSLTPPQPDSGKEGERG